MKLGDFIKGDGARPAATRSVTFRVLGFDKQMVTKTNEATAELAILSEAQRAEALRDADKVARELYGEAPVPPVYRANEEVYQMLVRALRDPDDVRQPFADGVKELKGALVQPEAERLWEKYNNFRDEEFPDIVDAETFDQLVDEAKKSFFSDLLSRFGSDVVIRLMPGLVARLRK